MKLNIPKEQVPNLLTFGRVAAVPIVLLLMVINESWVRYAILILFLASAATDFFDGYLARKWNATSIMGKLLDPIADKLLVALMLLFIVTHRMDYKREINYNVNAGGVDLASSMTVDETLSGYTLIVPVAIILLRELYISGLREFLAQKNVPLPVSQGSKWKTALQMTAIALFLLAYCWPVYEIWRIGEGVLWLAAAFTLVSAGQYTRTAWPHLLK